jgi:RHS repeat-associated protein
MHRSSKASLSASSWSWSRAAALLVICFSASVSAVDVGPTLFETGGHIGPFQGFCQTNGFWTDPEEACFTAVNTGALGSPWGSPPGTCANYTGKTPDPNRPGSFICFCASNPGATCAWADAICPPGRGIGGHAHPEMGDSQVYASPTNGVCPLVGNDRLKDSGDCDGDVNPGMQAGNPIHIGTGNKFEKEFDYEGPGANPVRLVRYYNSDGLFRPKSSFGRDWRGHYDRYIDESDGGGIRTVSVYRHTGKAYYFVLQGAAWISEPDVKLRLSAIMDGTGVQTGWRLETDADEVETYDTRGLLTAITSTSGRATQLIYDPLERLSKIVDANGREYGVTFVGESVHAIALPTGETIEFRYDTAKRLSEVEYPLSGVRGYRYEDVTYPRLLTGIIDERGLRIATWSYDTQRRATLSIHGDASSFVDRVEVTYLSPTQSRVRRYVSDTQFFDSTLGLATLHGMTKLLSSDQPCPSCGSSTATRTYDVNGFVDEETDRRGVVVDHDYNARGLEMRRIDAKRQGSNTALPEARTIETDWHASVRAPIERRTYDASNALVSREVWSRNARGQVSAHYTVDPVTSVARTTSYTYCEPADVSAPNSTCPLLGLVKSVDGPRADVSDVTLYTYYPSDDTSCASVPTTCPPRKGDLWKVTNALGHETEMLLYDGAGRVVRTVDPNGVVTDLEYHPRGWLTATKLRGADSASEADDAIVRIEYWPAGQVKRVTQPAGDFLEYEYDAASRLRAIEDALNNRIDYTLDAAGNRTAEVTRNDASQIKRQLSRVFDQLGRLDLEKNAAQQTTADYGYDPMGNPTSAVDSFERETRMSYDPLGRLMQTIQDYGGLNVQTTQHYDALDRLARVTDPKGLDTQYVYDGLGDLRQIVSPDSGTSTYTYDSAGNRATQTDARGVVTIYSHDELNRLTSITYPGNPGFDVTLQYDVPAAEAECGTTPQLGRLSRMVDASGTTDYCYDIRGNLLARRVSAELAVTMQWRYDAASSLTGMTYPSGLEVEYGHDANGRVKTVSLRRPGEREWAPVVADVVYLPFGPLQRMNFAGEQNLTWTYDADYVIDALDSTRPSGLQLDFARDALGNLTGVTSALVPEALDTYKYDELSRLTDLIGPDNVTRQEFSYDATGNRQSRTLGTATPETYVYEPQSHRLDSVAGISRSYDSVGNTLTIGSKSLSYGENNRLAAVTTADGTAVSFTYNGRGERVRKTTPRDGATGMGAGHQGDEFVYGLAGELLSEYRVWRSATFRLPRVTQFAPRQDHIYIEGIPVATVRWTPASITRQGIPTAHEGQTFHVEADHLGTPRTVSDPNTNIVVWKWDFRADPFGDAPAEQDPDADGENFVYALRYPGQYFDAETGLHYNYFRDYEPGTGRYIESDPIGLAGSINTFAYADSDPMRETDALGLQSGIPLPVPIPWPFPFPAPLPENPAPATPDYSAPGVGGRDDGRVDEREWGRPNGRGRYSCVIRCIGVEIFGAVPKPSFDNMCVKGNAGGCPDWIFGVGFGSSAIEAWNNAWDAANMNSPRGCQKRHCRGIRGDCKNWTGGKR